MATSARPALALPVDPWHLWLDVTASTPAISFRGWGLCFSVIVAGVKAISRRPQARILHCQEVKCAHHRQDDQYRQRCDYIVVHTAFALSPARYRGTVSALPKKYCTVRVV
jgi:hypothetical protein